MAVPERDIVDRCFSAARESLNDAEKHAAEAPTASGTMAVAMGARAIVHALEGLTHQVRDADDTIATVIKPALEGGLGDIAIAIGGRE